MSNDTYAAPSADLGTEREVIQTSIWSAKGRLGILSVFAQSMLATLVFTILAGLLVFVVTKVSGVDANSLAAGQAAPPMLLMLAIVPLLLLFAYVTWCQLIKRLHDRNHSGWLSLILVIPIVGALFSLYVMLFPGNKHNNNYGAQRPTKGWELVIGGIFFILTLAALAYAIFVAATQGLIPAE